MLLTIPAIMVPEVIYTICQTKKRMQEDTMADGDKSDHELLLEIVQQLKVVGGDLQKMAKELAGKTPEEQLVEIAKFMNDVGGTLRGIKAR